MKKVHLKIIFTFFIWSLFGPIYNKSSFTAFQNVFLMSSIAAILILFIFYWKKEFYLLKQIKFTRSLFIFSIISGMAGVIWFKSLTLIPIAQALFLLSSGPIFALLVELFIFKNKINLLHLLAIGIGFIGIFVLMYTGFSVGKGDFLTLGSVLALLAAFLFALQGFFIKSFGNIYHPQIINFIVLISTAMVSFFFIFNTKFIFDTFSILSTSFLSVFASVISFYFYINAIKALKVSTVRLIGYTEPLLGSIWGVIILSQSLHQATIVGGIFILTAAYLAVKSGE